MSTELETLARRAVACRHWRWMGGMQVVHTPPHDGATGYHLRLSQDGYIPAATEHPDLSDPATLGCLLALVREAWEPHRGQDPICSTMQWAGMWGVGARCGAEGFAAIVLPTHPTEAEALVAALEAAP